MAAAPQSSTDALVRCVPPPSSSILANDHMKCIKTRTTWPHVSRVLPQTFPVGHVQESDAQQRPGHGDGGINALRVVHPTNNNVTIGYAIVLGGQTTLEVNRLVFAFTFNEDAHEVHEAMNKLATSVDTAVIPVHGRFPMHMAIPLLAGAIRERCASAGYVNASVRPLSDVTMVCLFQSGMTTTQVEENMRELWTRLVPELVGLVGVPPLRVFGFVVGASTTAVCGVTTVNGWDNVKMGTAPVPSVLSALSAMELPLRTATETGVVAKTRVVVEFTCPITVVGSLADFIVNDLGPVTDPDSRVVGVDLHDPLKFGVNIVTLCPTETLTLISACVPQRVEISAGGRVIRRLVRVLERPVSLADVDVMGVRSLLVTNALIQSVNNMTRMLGTRQVKERAAWGEYALLSLSSRGDAARADLRRTYPFSAQDSDAGDEWAVECARAWTLLMMMFVHIGSDTFSGRSLLKVSSDRHARALFRSAQRLVVHVDLSFDTIVDGATLYEAASNPDSLRED